MFERNSNHREVHRNALIGPHFEASPYDPFSATALSHPEMLRAAIERLPRLGHFLIDEPLGRMGLHSSALRTRQKADKPYDSAHFLTKCLSSLPVHPFATWPLLKNQSNFARFKLANVYGFAVLIRMRIRSIQHRGLKRLIEDNDPREIRPDLANRVRNILTALITAEDMSGLQGPPGWRVHQLTADRAGTWSLSVSGNWRMTFTLDDGEICNLNLEDYH